VVPRRSQTSLIGAKAADDAKDAKEAIEEAGDKIEEDRRSHRR
jgi:hypothetical protein